MYGESDIVLSSYIENNEDSLRTIIVTAQLTNILRMIGASNQNAGKLYTKQ